MEEKITERTRAILVGDVPAQLVRVGDAFLQVHFFKKRGQHGVPHGQGAQVNGALLAFACGTKFFQQLATVWTVSCGYGYDGTYIWMSTAGGSMSQRGSGSSSKWPQVSTPRTSEALSQSLFTWRAVGGM